MTAGTGRFGFARRHAVSACACAWIAFVAPVYGERELTTDRPDATESPFTIEPGRVQVEASVVAYERDRETGQDGDVRVVAWNLAPVNVRVGLTPSTELQVIVDNYLDVEVKHLPTGQRVRERGFGDVTLRYKYNVQGNDGDSAAWGIMPFVKIPTNTNGLGNDSVEGGIIVPFAADLAGGWGFGAMTELDVLRNDADDGHDLVWLNTATVSRGLTEKLGAFLELTLEVGPGRPAATFNSGLTYTVTENLQLDAGVFIGLTRAAPDLSAFAGFAKRF